MKRKLFCEISPMTYRISLKKEIFKRHIKNIISFKKFSTVKSDEVLPIVICRHNSLIRRKLGNVDMKLQENKATNLAIAAPKINKVLIKPNETFSFWRLVGPINKNRGYLEGLTISIGKVGRDYGGGMCQFTNLIHWLVLHTNLNIIEHHHHNGLDMFPDFGRQVPFGIGTSISYNNLDYQFYNGTNITYQLIVYTTDEYLYGEIRASEPEDVKYHIEEDYSYFEKEGDIWYRNNQVSRRCIDKATGNEISRKIISKNHAKVLYDEKFIKDEQKKENINIKNLA